MAGAEAFRHQVGVDELVARFAAGGLEADREGAQVVLAGLGQQGHDQAGIHAAREQHADRHVGHHPAAHRGAQRVFDHPLALVDGQGGQRRVRLHLQAPEAPALAAALGVPGGHGGRRQLAHAGQQGERRRDHRVPAHVVVQCRGVDRRVDVAAGEQRRQRGREAQAPLVFRQVERLDPEAVARQREPPAVALEDREGEHAVETVDAVAPPGVKALEHHFRVAIGEEAVVEGFQLAPQFTVVVDAAVEDDGEPQARVGHRLLGGLREIDDAQPAMGQRDAALLEGARCVGAAGLEDFAHPGDGADVGGGRVEAGFTRKSAHEWIASLCRGWSEGSMAEMLFLCKCIGQNADGILRDQGANCAEFS